MEMDAQIKDFDLFYNTCLVLFVVILLFFLHSIPEIHLDLVRQGSFDMILDHFFQVFFFSFPSLPLSLFPSFPLLSFPLSLYLSFRSFLSFLFSHAVRSSTQPLHALCAVVYSVPMPIVC